MLVPVPPLTVPETLPAAANWNASFGEPPVRFSTLEKLKLPTVPGVRAGDRPGVGRVRPDQGVGGRGAADELLDVGEAAGPVAVRVARLTVAAATAVGRVVERVGPAAPPSTVPETLPVVNLNASVDRAADEPGDPREGDPVDVAGVRAGDGPGVGDVGARQRVGGAAAGDGRRGALGGRQDERVGTADAAVEDVGAAVAAEDVAGKLLPVIVSLAGLPVTFSMLATPPVPVAVPVARLTVTPVL